MPCTFVCWSSVQKVDKCQPRPIHADPLVQCRDAPLTEFDRLAPISMYRQIHHDPVVLLLLLLQDENHEHGQSIIYTVMTCTCAGGGCWECL